MRHIILDAMGGDNAPACTVQGAVEALRADPELTVTLAGTISAIQPFLTGTDDIHDRIKLLETPDIITNHDAPV